MLRKFILYVFFLSVQGIHSQETCKRTLLLMGSRFDITVVAANQEKANNYIDIAITEITRIEKLISSWDPNSQTSLINKNAGIRAMKVDLELFQLIERAIHISKLTDGAFDISYASMDRIWKFDGSMTKIPSKTDIKNSVSKVGYQNIILDKDKQTIFLKYKGMKIGFGGIGKGYAADKAKSVLKTKGVVAGIINASGDLNAWGKQTNGDYWSVAIKNPLNKNKVFALLPIYENAVVTSGNYEKRVTLNGKTFSHIIDPRTGYPSSGLVSASVFASSAELADALATSIFVMGKDVGLDFINQLKAIDCILVDDEGKVYYSNNVKTEENKTQ
ncbi:FAD:protein FMN transferase [Flavivirga algicola]|uniref:FAD:protein FMN transferase n=1 Tax=Flavivirga algicola TaxID=2729136 RepID=A0ABX1RXW0_9FLAO|nr:FAD:protein FMN transferase [Flavivirga algicola]NMH88407.1 FAD:protein FMN transferase [Flavivirga algicola]